MKVYVASLAKDIERRSSIVTQLKNLGLDYEIVDGVDGRLMSSDELSAACANGSVHQSLRWRPLRPAEVGCSLSHLKMYRRFLATGASHAVFLEDDAKILNGFEVGVLRLAEQNLDFVILGYPARTQFEINYADWIEPIFKAIPVGSRMKVGLSPRRKCFGMVGVMMSRHAAEILLQINSPVRTVADDHIFFSDYLRIYHVRPFLVAEDMSLCSAINQSYRIHRGGLSLRKKLSRLFQGFLMRVRIFALLFSGQEK